MRLRRLSHKATRPTVVFIFLQAVLTLVVFALMTGLIAGESLAQGKPDLLIEMYRGTDDTDPYAPGAEITYEIYFVNWSDVTANDVSVNVNLPEHSQYLFSSGPGFALIQAGPDQVKWQKQQLGAFERGWLSFTVKVDEDAPVGVRVSSEADISSFSAENDYSNNISSIQEFIRPVEPDLKVTKHLRSDSPPVAPQNEIVYEITVENRGATAASNVTVTDLLPADCIYDGDDVAESGFTTTQTGQTVTWTKPVMEPDAYGASATKLYLTCRVADAFNSGIDWLLNEIGISTTDAEYNNDNNQVRWTHKPEADRRYGASVTALDERSMRLASDAGLDYVLYYLDWSQAEPEDNEYLWSDLDSAVWQAWRYNLRLVVRVDRAPDWARGSGTASAPPADPATIGQFLQDVAARWPRRTDNPDAPQIYGYIIWNEPNLAVEWGGNAPDAVAYKNLLEAAYNGVKAGSANAWVISAGLAPTNDNPPTAVDDLTYLQEMYAAGFAGYCDWLGVNPLGFASAPDDTSDPNDFNFSRATAWRQIMVDNGDDAKNMFGTEMGWLRDTSNDLGESYNWMKVSDVDQAHYLSRAYHKAQCDWQRADSSPWMGPMMAWNLDFAGFEPSGSHQRWFALVNGDRRPLRSYTSLKNQATRGPADLWVEMELIDAVSVGQDMRYVIRYTNIGGNSSAANTTLTDTLPEGAEYVSDTAGGVLSAQGDQIEWNLGVVDPCSYETITLTVRLTDLVGAGDLVTNTAEASLSPEEPFGDDNISSVAVTIPVPAVTHVDDDFSAATPGWGYDHFASIQEGIDAAAEGGEIHVAAGTYAETVTMAQSLTLSPSDGVVLEGDLNLDAGTFSAPVGVFTLTGNLTHTGGSFVHGSGTVIFAGFGIQTLVSAALDFHNLVVNEGATLVLPEGVAVSGVLTNNGVIQQLRLVSGSAWVDYVNTGGYGGLRINANGQDLGDTLVRIQGGQECTSVPGETVRRCFEISPGIAPVGNTDLTFFFSDGDIPPDQTCAILNVFHWDETGWSAPLPLDPAYASGGRDCGDEPYSIQVIGIDDFSPFVLKSANEPTAVSLRHFQAEGTSAELIALLAVLVEFSLSLAGFRRVMIRR